VTRPNSAGPSAQAQLGWQGAKNIIGLRADANWAKPGEDSRYAGQQADPDILNFSADAKLQLPVLNHLFGAQHRFALYGIGGYTHTMYKNLPMRAQGTGTDGAIVVIPGEAKWTHQNGWNAGGGASLMWGRTELFVESRVLAFNNDAIPQARQMPFMLGINFYFSSFLSGVDNAGNRFDAAGAPVERPVTTGRPVTAMNWEIVPEGFTDLLVRLGRDYPGIPMVVTENGAAFNDVPDENGSVADENRIAYLSAHIAAVARARQLGADVRGYFAWSLMDNFEWAHGYAKRFGLTYVDYATQERIPKSSARWYGRVARDNALPEQAG